MHGKYCNSTSGASTGVNATNLLKVIELVERTDNKGESYAYQEWTYKWISATKKTIYSKGTTSYGTVTSTSSTAYKSGERNSDGYWYVTTTPQ